tara:strand:- start:947 stop:1414 length:468 start_codon:yes stop_codon:yes gene_type:complete
MALIKATGVKLTPAFEAHLSANQTPSNATYTKIEFDTEVFDTDNAYDNSTNYRFTPQVAGKYFVTAHLQTEVADDSLIDGIIRIYKNGSAYRRARDNPRNGGGERQVILHTTAIIDMNGSSDYLEVLGYVNVTAATGIFTSEEKGTYFSAYRIGD